MTDLTGMNRKKWFLLIINCNSAFFLKKRVFLFTILLKVEILLLKQAALS